MRMRKKKHTEERINACVEFTRWRAMLENKNSSGSPVHLEIGCGKGEFICEKAKKFPDINFIAVEKSSDVIVIAIEKAKSFDLPNVKFAVGDIQDLAVDFEPGIFSVIYLNFSDPWHKRYQHNKRLTAPSFLEIYKKILKPNGIIIMKTDNKDLFDFSLKTLSSDKFIIKHKTYDLYNSEYLSDNIQTEYEKNFVSQNIPICYLETILS